jgi:hypothetical protein
LADHSNAWPNEQTASRADRSPFSPSELKRREQLTAYLDRASEDELIEDVLLPLFRELGFFIG